MAYTSINDIIYQSVLRDGVLLRSNEKNKFYSSGIMRDVVNDLDQGEFGGYTVQIRNWLIPSSDSEVPTPGTPLNVEGLSQAKQVAPVLVRAKAFGSDYTVAWFGNEDPLALMITQLGDYWAREEEKILTSILQGIEGVANFSPNVIDKSATTLTVQDLATAPFVLGDAWDEITAIAVHPDTMAYLTSQEVISYVQPSTVEPPVPTYMGKRIIVDSSLPVDAGPPKVYRTYLFAEGVFGRGNAKADAATFGLDPQQVGEQINGVAMTMEHDPLNSRSVLITYHASVIHPFGFQWAGPNNPSNTDLANAANWTYDFPNSVSPDPRYTKLVIMKHQLP